MAIKWLKKREDRMVSTLLEGLDDYSGSVMRDIPEYRPFHGRENASVAMLVAASSKMGLLPLSEFPVHKKSWDVAHCNPPSPFNKLGSDNIRFPCWADFWVSDGNGASVLIEFKQTTEQFSVTWS